MRRSTGHPGDTGSIDFGAGATDQSSRAKCKATTPRLIKNGASYDAAIREKLWGAGKTVETPFFELGLDDITRAANLFRPIYDRTNGVDGRVSLEISPLLAHDTASTLAAAKDLHTRARRPNLVIKSPSTREGLLAIEEAIFAGRPSM